MASKSSNFLDGLEFYFMTKKPEKVQRFEITASDSFNENPRTHVLFPRGVNYHSNNKLVGSLERTRAILDAVGKAYDLPNFHAKIDRQVPKIWETSLPR